MTLELWRGAYIGNHEAESRHALDAFVGRGCDSLDMASLHVERQRAESVIESSKNPLP